MIGFYSINLERFFLIEDDRWLSLTAAKILSSKFLICVIEFDGKKCNNSNCHTWGVKDTSLIFSDLQLPRLQILNDQVIDKTTCTTDLSVETFKNYQKYCKFTYDVIRASRMTDALLNGNDQSYILSLFDKIPDGLQIFKDDTGLHNSFLTDIDKILYFSHTVQEAKTKIDTLFLTKTDMVSNFCRYKKNFL